MNRAPLFLVLTLIFTTVSGFSQENHQIVVGAKSQAIIDMISAVNKKDAVAYVNNFSDSVKVYVESELKVNGKYALRENRHAHFKKHPKVRSEVQHVVEIDDKVILHDKIWLDGKNDPQDIVEIFSFENNEVVRDDVIQPKNLFKPTGK